MMLATLYVIIVEKNTKSEDVFIRIFIMTVW